MDFADTLSAIRRDMDGQIYCPGSMRALTSSKSQTPSWC
jgi:hypothetical protein